MAESFAEVDLKSVDPHSFWVSPIRGYPLSPEIAEIISLESQLKDLAKDPKNRVNARTDSELNEGLIVGVTVILPFLVITFEI